MNIKSTIVGTTLLVVLLTAGAAQSLSGSNTVFSDDIVAGAVHGSDIAADAVGGAKIYPNSVTGSDVNESSLLLACPGNLSRVASICYESALNSSASLFNAAAACRSKGLRLPSVSEALAVVPASGNATQIWADVLYVDGDTSESLTIGDNDFNPVGAGATYQYRCVTTVGGRP